MLYHGSNIWTCLINLKSIPSEPAFEIKITFTLLPSLLSSFVNPFTSKSLFGDNLGSPVIIAYLAGIKSFLFVGGCIVLTSTTSDGLFLNKGFTLSPYRVNPNSSNASAIGIKPLSIY